jgi:hypothetical protein
MISTRARAHEAMAVRGTWQRLPICVACRDVGYRRVDVRHYASTTTGSRAGHTGSLHLDWRARHRTVGTEHAAVTWLRLEARAAAGALVKEPACIGRHGLGPGRTAMGARDDGYKDHDCKPMCEVPSGRAIASQFVARWAGYPALVLAAAIASTVVVASLKTTVAVLLL